LVAPGQQPWRPSTMQPGQSRPLQRRSHKLMRAGRFDALADAAIFCGGS